MSGFRGRIKRLQRQRRERKMRRGGIARAGYEPRPIPESIANRRGFWMNVRRINERDRAIGAGGDIRALLRDPQGREAIASLSGDDASMRERRRRRRRTLKQGLKVVGGDDG